MNESEKYLDELLNAADSAGSSDDEDRLMEVEDSFLDEFERELRTEDDSDEFLKQFEKELALENEQQSVTKAAQPMLDDIDQIMSSVGGKPEQRQSGSGTSAQQDDYEYEKDDSFGIEEGDPFSDFGESFLTGEESREQESELSEEGSLEQKKTKKKKKQKEKKEKEKGGFLKKLKQVLFGDAEEDKIESTDDTAGVENRPDSGNFADMSFDILNELEGVAKEPSAEEQKVTPKETETKKEKKEKKKKPKKEKKPKEKKEKKPKPPAEPDNTPPLPKVPVILIFVMAASVLALIIIGTNYTGYKNSFSNAEQAYEEGDYSGAYESVAGISVKEKDRETYRKYYIVGTVAAEYEAYTGMMELEIYDMALDSLIRVVQRYDKYIEDADTYGCRRELDKLAAAAETVLAEQFGISVEKAREIYAIADKETYTREIQSVLSSAGYAE